MEPGADAARYLIRIRSCHIRFANLLQHLPQLVRPVGRSMNDITRWKCHVYTRRGSRERSSYSLTSLELWLEIDFGLRIRSLRYVESRKRDYDPGGS